MCYDGTCARTTDDIALLKTYGVGPYTSTIKKLEKEIDGVLKRVNEVVGIKESDTGLAQPSLWDLVADKQKLGEPLQVARYDAFFFFVESFRLFV